MLQSAMGYCQSAGLPVTITQDGNDLVVRLAGVRGQTSVAGTTSFALARPVASVAIGAVGAEPAALEHA